MSDLELKEQTQIVKFNPFDKEQFDVMQRVCKLYASSDLPPEMYKTSATNPENKAMANCMIAVEMSLRIDASVLMIMQNMSIIHGRPSWASKFLIATVNTCGRFNPLRFKFKKKGELGDVEYTEYTKQWTTNANGKGYYKTESKVATFKGGEMEEIECVAWTTAKGSDEVLESSPVSLSLAIKEGWYTKAGSKWQTMPEQMLRYRAASFWTSAYAPELSMGMRTVEEQQDIIDIDYEVIPDTEKVKEEVDSNGNKETISMDKPTATEERVQGGPIEGKESGNEKSSEKAPEQPVGKREMPEMFGK